MSDLRELYELDAEALEERLLEHVGRDTWPPVHEAVALSRRIHEGQERKDTTDYVRHPLRTALILVELAGVRDPTALCAALLHDALEDTALTAAEIEETFGVRTADLVRALTLPRPKDGQTWHEVCMAHFDKLAWAPRDAQIVRSADRLDNLNTLAASGMEEERRREYLEETEKGLMELTLACNTPLYHALRERLEALRA